MKEVAETSIKIFNMQHLTDQYQKHLITTIAWLHDVNDHKYYDSSMDKKINNFLNNLKCEFRFPEYFPEQVRIVIVYISFSKQAKIFGDKPADWGQVLPSNLILVRHIVSDADKIAALGEVGVKRCIGYSQHCHPEAGTDFHEIHFVEHYQEKLGRLKDEFIMTSAGKQLAEEPHQIMTDFYHQFLKKHHSRILNDKLEKRPNCWVYIYNQNREKQFATIQVIQDQVYIFPVIDNVHGKLLDGFLKEDQYLAVL